MDLVYSVFLLASAWYDIRTAKIPIWLLIVFGVAGVLGMAAGMRPSGYTGLAAAFLPGIFLLLVTLCTKGAAGPGDGCFFIVSACYLGASGTIILFLCALLFCGTCSLGMAAWGFIHGINAGKMRLPFLPFILPAWLWLLFVRMLDVL